METTADFFGLFDALTPAQRDLQHRIRAFLEVEVRPIVADHWERGAFPHHLIPRFGWLLQQLGPDPVDPLMKGILKLEMGRVDPSTASFVSVHWGLARGAIARWGTPAQQTRWLEPMRRMTAIGSFALTEPMAGSDVARSMACRAVKRGDGWRLTGEKKWAGSATFADVIVVIARSDEGCGAFLVEKGAPGLSVDLIEGKIAKRALENGHVFLDDAPAERLPGVTSFRHVAEHLVQGRVSVAWEACGIAMGAYEVALRYARERHQFGRPLAANQLVQAELVEMLSSVTAMQCMLLQLTRGPAVTSARASLAKRFCARRCREVVASARALLGGNGVLLDYGVAHLFADAEAVITYEGTDAINALIVGRHITGEGAF